MKKFLFTLACLSILASPAAKASVTIMASPFANSASNPGGLGVGAGYEISDHSKTFILNLLNVEASAKYSGTWDLLFSSGVYVPASKTVWVGARAGTSLQEGSGTAAGFGAIALRVMPENSMFFGEVALGVVGSGTNYARATIGISLF